jgi:hypothetical protein
MIYYEESPNVGCTASRPDGMNFTSLLIGVVMNSTMDPKKLSVVKCADFHNILILSTTEGARVYGGHCPPDYVSIAIICVNDLGLGVPQSIHKASVKK